MVKSKREQDIIDALELCAPQHGIDVVDVEVTGATKAPCVRVRIDKPDAAGISLDEVAANTAWVSEVVEELDPFPGSYILEVSSPGLERPLRRPSDFARFIGSEVQISTTAVEGRRRWTGAIRSVDEASVVVSLEDGQSQSLAHDQIKKANLRPAIDFKSKKEGK